MKNIILFLLMSTCLYSTGQNIYQPGYFINKAGVKTECLIKNNDQSSNPSSFKFKLNKEGEVMSIAAMDIKEIEVFNKFKYVTRLVELERSISNSNLDLLDTFPELEFNEEKVLLRTLVEGPASLYKFEEGNVLKYFLEVGDTEITQLIYKKFRRADGVGSNNEFKKQLFKSLKCEDLSPEKFQKIDYYKSDITNLVTSHNECTKKPFTDYTKMGTKGVFKINVRPGINFAKIESKRESNENNEVYFESQISPRFGVELEYVLPINNSKWSVFVEPTYQQYSSETEVNLRPDSSAFTDFSRVVVDYSSIEVPIGIRHYMFLNENSKIFLDSGFMLDFVLNDKVEFENVQTDLVIESKPSLFLSLGYKFQDKYILAVRFNTPKTTGRESSSWETKFYSTSLILGYTIF